MLVKYLPKIVFTLTIIVFFAQSLGSVRAQEAVSTDPVIKDVAGLRLQLVEHTQDPSSQQVKFELVIYSQIDSDRVQVTWTVKGSGKLNNESKQTIAKIESGKVYRAEALVQPQAQGTIELSAKVEAFAADGIRLSTASQTIGVYPSREIFPITANYRIAQIALVLRAISAVGIILILGFFLAKFAYKLFRKWLDRDEHEELAAE